jgi:hypothetical protein
MLLTTLTSLKKTDRNKIDYYQRVQRYACVDEVRTRGRHQLVMLIRAYGGCLGTKSR